MIKKIMAGLCLLAAPWAVFAGEDAATEKPAYTFKGGEIVITDSARPNIESAGLTTTVNEDEMKSRSDKTLADVLFNLPGFTTYQSAKGTTVFDLRGFGHDKLALLVDGLPFEEVYYGGGGDISRISVLNASKVVVNRGVSSALYGTAGMFGTINVVTKKPEEPFAEVAAEYGEHGNYTLTAAHGAPIGDFYYWITASMQNSNGYETSKKLDAETRREWLDKFVQYDIYGKTYDNLDLEAIRNYLNDDNVWNHTEYRRYNVSAKAGYNITKDLEVGVSTQYYLNRQEFNSFQPNTVAYYRDSTGKYSTPKNTAYTTDGKSAALVNYAFCWPEDYRWSVMPYLVGNFGMFDVRVQTWFVRQENDLVPYGNQSETLAIFPASLEGASNTDVVHSIYTDTSMGAAVYPSISFSPQHKLSFALNARQDRHCESEQAVNETLSAGVIAIRGNDRYMVKDVSARYVTLAAEDEFVLPTAIGRLAFTAGISWDMQDVNTFKALSEDPATLNQLKDRYIMGDDSTIYGSRDAFNPVAGLVFDPIEDVLRFRMSASAKTEFPSLKVYSSVDAADIDKQVKPERSYNGNAGAEVWLLSKRVNLRADYFYSDFRDKIERIYDRDLGKDVYSNIDGRVVQGSESTVAFFFTPLEFLDLNCELTHVYIHAENKDDSSMTYGEGVENTPEQQYIARLVLRFTTGTALNFWGQYSTGQKRYVMSTNPGTAAVPYSQEVYTMENLHNPLMINIKLSQKILEKYEMYVMCKNVMDDYNADPFNPGPGRMFYAGGSAKF